MVPYNPIRLALDRDLPVPLGVQLRGLIQYGISSGDLKPGDRLPSVRDLADEAGVAPMTIVQVYREMKEAGLIEGRAGSGTFVARPADPLDQRLQDFHKRVDAVLDQGLALGLSSNDIAGLIATRLTARNGGGRTWQVMMVGNFAHTTADYAQVATSILGPGVAIEPVTFDILVQDEGALRRAAAADFVVASVVRQREVSALLPGQRVVAIGLIPSEDTRRALASIDPRARVIAVSLFPDFLPILSSGVRRFAPHVATLNAAMVDSEELEAAVAHNDVVVYSSGAEAVLDLLPPGVPAIEYRHTPDPGDIERLLRPLLEGVAPTLRSRASGRDARTQAG